MNDRFASILAGLAKLQDADLSEHQDTLREIDSKVWELVDTINEQEDEQ